MIVSELTVCEISWKFHWLTTLFCVVMAYHILIGLSVAVYLTYFDLFSNSVFLLYFYGVLWPASACLVCCLIWQVMGWVSEKMQVALDESYRDPTNLQGKIQKHQAYEAELTANRKRIDVVSAVSISPHSLLVPCVRYLRTIYCSSLCFTAYSYLSFLVDILVGWHMSPQICVYFY